jgi:hypothetical protein
MDAMRVLPVVVLAAMAACGGAKKSASTAGPIAPSPPITQQPAPGPGTEPATPDPAKEQVAIAEDPDAGGEIAEDPDAGGEVNGAPGLGLRGSGQGGGGVGTGTIGIGSGTGQTYGAGPGGGRPIQKNENGQIRFGTPTVKGELDKDIIRRVIRRNANQIRYCLENRLRADPTTSGLLTLRLVIGADGTVKKAEATGVHKDVSACVASRASTWLFPKPKSGVVAVQQPINMSPR